MSFVTTVPQLGPGLRRGGAISLRAAGTISTISIVQTASLAPPRRRPGSRWGGRCDGALSFVTTVPQLGPGLRRGGVEWGGGLSRRIAWCRSDLSHLPGGGRGPGGEVVVTTCCPALPPSPNWAPAFAGVVVGWWGGVLATHVELFPREGGDPVWAPAFAGEQGGAAYGESGGAILRQERRTRSGHRIAGAG